MKKKTEKESRVHRERKKTLGQKKKIKEENSRPKEEKEERGQKY